jgi:hypothetical protein
MPKRRQFADRERLEQVEEVPVPAPQPEETQDAEREEGGSDLPVSILRLQEAVGNQALSRALRERFALPGAEPAAGMQAAGLGGGVEDLVGKSPLEQVSLFTAMADSLPPESQELLRTANEASSQGASGGKMNAGLLKSLARSRLAGPPAESAIKDPGPLVDRLCDAVSFAWEQWQRLSFFTNVMVHGPAAYGGQLQGPPMGPFVLAYAGMSSGPEVEAAQAVAGALDEGMKIWEAQPKFGGLPLYPTFAAMPMPMSPATPNLPVPVLALIGGGVPPPLNAAGRVSDPGAQAAADAVLGAITGGAFDVWAASTLVTNVMALGPVPSYAPPYVPVGPVMGGMVLPIPGVLT